MTSVIEAQSGIANVGVKAKNVQADSTLTNAEKMTRLDALTLEAKGFKDAIAIHDAANRLMGGAEAAPEAKSEQHVETRGFARQVIDSAAYKSMLSGSRFAQIDVKAAATIDEGIIPAFSGGAGLAGQLNAPQLLPGIVPIRFQPLTVADLIAQGTTSATSVSYVIEAAFQDLTGVVAEKGAIPQLDLTLTRRQDNVSKIANISKVTVEMFQDAEQFQAYLQNRMVFGLQRKEEQQLLNGTGTTPELQGLLNRAGLAAAITTTAGLTAAKIMEGIFNQITALRSVSFVEPDAILINPLDWQTIRLGKDGQQQYYAGGPFTGAYGNAGPSNVSNLWGVKTVITTAIAQGTAFVGGFQECAQIFRRNGVVLDMTNSNNNDFETDMITLKAEERLALSVIRPAGFGKVLLTA
ncbi:MULTISPECIES: phage major capsid protein [unclassified Cryobacterium]|uniref:phage major capsid protein n=1 Tax=unclassified Cryobacterium TaxID=2649013 RepID=UPI001069FCA7|nr:MULTISPECIES: phage major capsid protein [unclassified Cryobacterium]TFB96530.1 phage major capsid protein [Cryobacterium sp. MDB2-A-1]TFC12815.1 phage major capsid protein [Cryobacterium sp. MDB2-A-2]